YSITGDHLSLTSNGASQFYFIVSLSALFFLPAMTMQFISHQFPDYHDPTIEDAYKTQVRIDDEPAYLDILDTAGQLKFTAMRDQYMRGGEGFIICYSITDRQSFQEAAEFKELIYRVRHTYNIPLVLVGNKIDLEEFRQVSKTGCPFLKWHWHCWHHFGKECTCTEWGKEEGNIERKKDAFMKLRSCQCTCLAY
uniref:Ras like without CAAX 2 n=1 Tax=Sphenodon punctatus TaxID=8508 RepID=A0A8D0GDS6_SPHPU